MLSSISFFDSMRRIERAIETRLKEAQQAGDVAGTADLRAMAVNCVSNFQGLCVMGRLTRDKKRLRIITAQTMQALINNN